MINLIKKILLTKLAAILFSTVGLILLVTVAVIIMITAYIEGSASGRPAYGFSPINITPEVEQYREKVEMEAIKQDIPETVDMILAIMMQESGGLVPDVLQASESQGLPPNTITDPYVSIEVGVEYFSVGYKHANENGTVNVNETSIQGYNFGFSFIPWAIDKSQGWTQENAIEFACVKSNGQQRTNGQWMYGDQFYVENVLRYLGSDGEIVIGHQAWPVPHTKNVTSLFDPNRIDPFYGEIRAHNGIDIAGGNDLGKEIVAFSDGEVVYSQYNNGGYGYLVIVQHENNVKTYYAHLQKKGVPVGTKVKAGEVIGYMGTTGASTGVHLHFEIRINDVPIDALPILGEFNLIIL